MRAVAELRELRFIDGERIMELASHGGGAEAPEDAGVADGGERQRKPRGRKPAMPEVDPFVEWLVADQARRGESDTAYAKRRHISRAQFSNAKSRRRGLSRVLIERICQLDEDARCAYLRHCLRAVAVLVVAVALAGDALPV